VNGAAVGASQAQGVVGPVPVPWALAGEAAPTPAPVTPPSGPAVETAEPVPGGVRTSVPVAGAGALELLLAVTALPAAPSMPVGLFIVPPPVSLRPVSLVVRPVSPTRLQPMTDNIVRATGKIARIGRLLFWALHIAAAEELVS